MVVLNKYKSYIGGFGRLATIIFAKVQKTMVNSLNPIGPYCHLGPTWKALAHANVLKQRRKATPKFETWRGLEEWDNLIHRRKMEKLPHQPKIQRTTPTQIFIFHLSSQPPLNTSQISFQLLKFSHTEEAVGSKRRNHQQTSNNGFHFGCFNGHAHDQCHPDEAAGVWSLLQAIACAAFKVYGCSIIQIQWEVWGQGFPEGEGGHGVDSGCAGGFYGDSRGGRGCRFWVIAVAQELLAQHCCRWCCARRHCWCCDWCCQLRSCQEELRDDIMIMLGIF